MKKQAIGLAAAGAVGAVVLAAGVPALAATDDSTATPSPSAPSAEDRQELRAEAQRDLAERLAEELGVDADEVEAALETVRDEMQAEHQARHLESLKERLDQAVTDGELTQEQADAILEAAESGVFPGGGRGHHGPGGPGGFGGPGAGASDGTVSGTSLTVIRT
jgi:glycine/D-amino acid oxidase-like deaminating enzyme